MNQYHKLYTPADSAIVFIDQQPQMLFGVANADRATLINNTTLLAKVAKEFNVPAVLTAVETESFSGYIWPQLLDIFPGQPVVERSSMNSWDDAGFRKAIEATGRKNIIMTGLWTEVCITWPTIEMLGAGYNIYVVEDCCGATSPAAQEAALSRMVQAGAVRLTTIARIARMAARLEEQGALQQPHGIAQTAGRRLRHRRRIRLHDGPPRPAVGPKAANRAQESTLMVRAKTQPNMKTKAFTLSLALASLVATARAATRQQPKENVFETKPLGIKVSIKMIGPYTQAADLQIICLFKHKTSGDTYQGAAKETDDASRRHSFRVAQSRRVRRRTRRDISVHSAQRFHSGKAIHGDRTG